MPNPSDSRATRASPRLAAGGIVLRTDGRVLLIQRGRPPGLGSWTIPGGKVEAGETPEHAVVREVREETGLDVRVVRFLQLYDLIDAAGVHAFVIHEFECAPIDENAALRPADDAADARWVAMGELAPLGVSDDARAVIALAARRDKDSP